jgi:signal transduction histidine kinase
VANVLESGEQLLALVNEILDIAKVEAGHMELRFEELDLVVVLEEIVETVLPVAHKAQIELKIAESAEPGYPLGARSRDAVLYIYADRGRFIQIMNNLLSNAVKFTPAGGIVTVSYRKRGELVEIAVTDTGIGIAAENQERIFEQFEQVDSTAARHHQGTGLGLALTKQLVKLQGGSITVQSEEGRGATFTVTLRCVPGSGLKHPSYSPVQVGDGTRELRASVLAATDGADSAGLGDGATEQQAGDGAHELRSGEVPGSRG